MIEKVRLPEVRGLRREEVVKQLVAQASQRVSTVAALIASTVGVTGKTEA